MFIFHVNELRNAFQSQSSVSSAAIESRSAYYGTNHYSKFALEAVLYEILDKAADALANVLLQDVGNLQIHRSKQDETRESVLRLLWILQMLLNCLLLVLTAKEAKISTFTKTL